MIQSDEKKYHAHGLEELTLLMWTYYPGKLQAQFNLYRNTVGIFHRARTNNLKFVWKHRRPWIAKAIQGNKKKASNFLVSKCITKL